MKKHTERIYLAAPYSPKDCTLHDASRVAQQNVDRAIDIALQLIKKGHYVFIPHLTHYVHLRSDEDFEELYYVWDNTFLNHWATALFYVSPSYGADLELERAKELRLKIYYSLEDVPDVK